MPVKRPDDKAEYCHWNVVSSSSASTRYSLVEWTGARPMGEQCWGLSPMSISSELGHLAVPMNPFLLKKKNNLPKRVSNQCPALPLRHTGSTGTGFYKNRFKTRPGHSRLYGSHPPVNDFANCPSTDWRVSGICHDQTELEFYRQLQLECLNIFYIWKWETLLGMYSTMLVPQNDWKWISVIMKIIPYLYPH